MSDGKAGIKNTFIVRKKYRWQIKKLSQKQRAELLEYIFLYQTEWRYKCEDPLVWMLMDIMVDERKNDSEKYDKKCQKNRATALEREEKKREKKEKKSQSKSTKTKKSTNVHERAQKAQTCTNSTDIWYMTNDCDKWQMVDDCGTWLKEISSNEEIEQRSYWDKEINDLIDQIKQECDLLGIAYDKQDDRNFARHILTAKEYWAFCEKIWQSRVEFAINILRASVGINYWKICSWPMLIYKNYVGVYNETLKYKAKNSKNLIQSF